MANMICRCGERLSNTMCPNDIEYRVYSDREWEKILENDHYNSYEIPEPRLDVWKCPVCERIYIFDGQDILIKVYAIEED